MVELIDLCDSDDEELNQLQVSVPQRVSDVVAPVNVLATASSNTAIPCAEDLCDPMDSSSDSDSDSDSSNRHARPSRQRTDVLLGGLRQTHAEEPAQGSGSGAGAFSSAAESAVSSLVPLRERASAGASSGAGHAGSSISTGREQTREQLCDTTALHSFARMLLKCSPPAPPQQQQQHHRHRDQGVRGAAALHAEGELEPHWAVSDLQPLPASFASTRAHGQAFFLPLVEECRAGVGGVGAEAEQEVGANTVSAAQQQQRGEGGGAGIGSWYNAEVVNVIPIESDTPLPAAKASAADTSTAKGNAAGSSAAQLGTIMLLRLCLTHASAGAGGASAASNGRMSPPVPAPEAIGGGDVVLLRLPSASSASSFSSSSTTTATSSATAAPAAGAGAGAPSRGVLGLCPGWDPTYEAKHCRYLQREWTESGGATSANSLGPSSVTATRDAWGRTVVSVLVCVHAVGKCSGGGGQGQGQQQGGWALQGQIQQHARIQICVLGCAITAMREAAALRHVRFVNEPLRKALLESASGTSESRGCGDTCKETGPGRTSATEVDMKTQAGGKCHPPPPPRVPAALWAALSKDHDISQLTAIRAVCCTATPAAAAETKAEKSAGGSGVAGAGAGGIEQPPPPITLLCGPPGTGKTSTIMGIIAVLLAGGGIPGTDSGSAGTVGDTGGTSKPKVGVVAGVALRMAKGKSGSRSPSKVRSSGSNHGGKGAREIDARNARRDMNIMNVPSTRILICAPSNTAVDELVLRVLTSGIRGADGRKYAPGELNVIRVGIPGGHGGNHHGTTPRGVLPDHKDQTLLESVSLDFLIERDRRAYEVKYDCASGGAAAAGAAQQMRNANAFAGAWSAAARNKERMPSRSELSLQYLQNAHVVCCTLSGAGSQPLLEYVLNYTKGALPGTNTGRKPHLKPFGAVIIDEAAQATEPACLVPLRYDPPQVVLVGDPAQLQPTLRSMAAKAIGYGRSLFERLCDTATPAGEALSTTGKGKAGGAGLSTGAGGRRGSSVSGTSGVPYHRLSMQYRMLPVLAQFPSDQWYDGQLRTAPHISHSDSHARPYHSHPSGLFAPLVLHDLAYGRQRRERVSISNLAEAKYVVRLYLFLRATYPEHFSAQSRGDASRGQGHGRVAIIAAYRAQRLLIQRQMREALGGAAREVEVGTIDGFQGREKDIVILSCVRAPAEGTGSAYGGGVGGSGSIGFLSEPQRMNVALTRARCAMWVVGHADTLAAAASVGAGAGREWPRWVGWMRSRDQVVHIHEEGEIGARRPSPRSDFNSSSQRAAAPAHQRNERHRHDRRNSNSNSSSSSNSRKRRRDLMG